MYKCIGNYYLNHNDPGNAIDCFSKGLDIDPLSESFYQELIKSYCAQRKYAEAAAVYQQCRKQLSMAFGVSPSPETIRLFKETVKQ
jgi:two-component SAPR family response regulator